MMRAFAALAPLAFVLWLQAPQAAPTPQTTADEGVLRGLVQTYYEAQTKKDADTAAGFWSTSVSPRMGRESYLAVFAAGDAEYTPEIQSVTIKGTEARLRIAVAVTRTIVRNEVSGTTRQRLLIAQLWRKEGAAWKLVREGPFAEDVADQLIAAAPADRAAILAEHPIEQNASLRYVLSQRATMAITLAKNYPRARELFELALEVARIGNDRHGQANSHHNLAQIAYFLGDHAAATAAYEKELALGREIPAQDVSAAALFGLATVAYSRGEYTPAVGFYRDALVIYEKMEDGAAIGRAVVSIGNIQYLQAEYDLATASYRRALSVLVAAGDPQGASFARSGLARVFTAQGDFAAGLDMYGQVLTDTKAAAAQDPRMKTNPVAPLESIGDIHFRLGNIDQARSAFDEARRLAEGEPEMAARVYGELGLIEIVAGRFDVALADYTESKARYETAKKPVGVAAAWTGIGFSHAASEKFAEAIPAYRTAIRIFEAEKENESSGRAWLGLSLAQSGAKEYPAALESALKVRTIAALVKSRDLVWRADVRVGEVLRKLTKPEEAQQAFLDAIKIIDRVAADVPTNPEARRQLDDSASAWTGLALTFASRGDAAGALAAVEARRAHARRVQLGAFQPDITRGMTAEERTEEQTIVRELISTWAQLRAEADAKKPDVARLERLQQQATTLIAKRANQQSRLYSRLPELQLWRGLKPAADDMNALVPDAGSLLVEYLVADDELLIVTVAHRDPAAPVSAGAAVSPTLPENPRGSEGGGPDVAATVVPFKRRDLADKIEQAMQPAVLQDNAEWRKKAVPIATVLIEPIAARLRDRDRVVVVPDDLLWKVPFEALPAGEGTLASKVRLTYATSLGTLAAQRNAAQTATMLVTPAATSSATPTVVAGLAGAPAIPAAIRAQVALTSQAWKEPDPEASLAAAGEIAKVYGAAATVRTAADASEAAVRTLLETSDVVHVLAPLQMSGPTPLFSSLLLAGATAVGDSATAPPAISPDNDGRLEARDWFNLNGRARVLVIPDASTFGAAGVAGAMDVFAWAAAAANISSMVIGRWPADGFSRDAFLLQLHAQLAKGTPIGEAWRAATVSAREKAGAAPAGWAGLRLLGGGPR
jgi:tetratricopeptide (TPR) repeat protein